MRQTEYDLLLSPDLNTRSHVQWFYFRVSNVDNGVHYRFNIINLEKPGSQYNGGRSNSFDLVNSEILGMQPVVFSVKEAMNGHPYWFRAGGRVKYYKNYFLRHGSTASKIPHCFIFLLLFCLFVEYSRNYYTATFSLQFQHRGDVCYIAYHYPYTHSRLLADLTQWQLRARKASTTSPKSAASRSKMKASGLYFRVQNLTSTLLGNLVPLITITEASEGPRNFAG